MRGKRNMYVSMYAHIKNTYAHIYFKAFVRYKIVPEVIALSPS